MSKVIANRIKSVLSQIIHHSQTGFIEDRYIGETVRLIFEWSYFQHCLESFNFGPEFIRWVMTFYNNIQSCVINNGITSDYFTLK